MKTCLLHHKMAAERGRNSDYVTEFLNKRFGDNVQLLKDVCNVYQEQENLRINLEKKIRICQENTSTKIRKSNEDGREMLEKISCLVDEKTTLEEKGNHHLSEQNDFCLQLENLNNQIEEINCLQVYMSWIFQICHLSKELKTEIEKGNLSIAVEFSMNLAEITERLRKSSCKNLVDYAISTNSHWMKVLSDILSKNMMVLLNEMKWPFPSGISSPALNDNNQEIMSQFESLALLLLKLNYKRNKDDDLVKDGNIKQLTTVLVTPLQKRFAFHFYGPRKTNNIEKPEWYFTQVLNWIRDHSQFLIDNVQPLVQKAGISQCSIQHEFISELISICTEKIKSSLQQISSNETLLSHFIDEVLSFDEEIKSFYNYPSNLPGCTSALLSKPYLDQWLQIEKKAAVKMIDDILAKDELFNMESNDIENIVDDKTPSCVQYFMLHLSLITERYRNLDDTEAQLRFVELQIYLLVIFIKRLKEIAKEANVSSNNDIFYSLLNGCHYMIEILNEWTEQVFYIQLHCSRLQLSINQDLTITRLEDSFHEETSIESTTENSDYFVDKTLFDEIITNLNDFISSLLESLSKRIEANLRPFIMQYASTTWHSLPSSKDIVTPILSNSACHLLMFIKESLRSSQNELCHSIFTTFWQNLARAIDLIIFNQVILESHFNEGGAVQIKFDLMKNLLMLFQGYTQKPESYFKLIKESCSLLTLLPGSAVLLKELLKSAAKSEKQTDAINALLDIGIKNISVSLSYRILCSRIDLPKV